MISVLWSPLESRSEDKSMPARSSIEAFELGTQESAIAGFVGGAKLSNRETSTASPNRS